ncbi:hypothetical protein [Microbacterium sp. TNHR37B]|uniref:hypothetical protein n=1 Tax=Microbacterium sp. TNHR37B TaxID=1775956 RepID=UPI0007B2CEB9|nr:hypothetical protein [Microbacterium sp. TNHR37B]KZE90526.1 hypothetical protein AVP41_00045 [Microbacterium sp. TNHR37B]
MTSTIPRFVPTSKPKTSGATPSVEHIRVPVWFTSAEIFQGSVLSEMLHIPEGSGFGYLVRPADPLGPSTASVNRLLTDVVQGWLDENLTDPAVLNPEDYLFDRSEPEPVPSAWLEALFALPVRENTTLMMYPDEE